MKIVLASNEGFSASTNTDSAGVQNSVALGSNARVRSGKTNSIAIGTGADVNAETAVQISSGTNITPKSLQFRDCTIAKEFTINGEKHARVPLASLEAEVASADHTHSSIVGGDTTVSAVNGGTATIAKSGTGGFTKTVATTDQVFPRTLMVPLGDGVWQFMDGNTGILVIDGEVTTLPASKTSFETEEYFENANLTLVYAPSVETVGNDAFSYCDALASVSLPAATSIRNRAFSYCGTLASVLLPAATSIGGSAFYGCDALASVSLPAATSIGGYAFAGCGALASIDLSSFTVAQVQANAAGWGISPPSGKTVTVTCSDGTVTIQG